MKTIDQASSAQQNGSHAHNVAPDGGHSHSITPPVAHGHNVTDPGHAHPLALDGAAAAQPEPPKDPNSYTLDTPITRGGQTIDKITLRKPSAGELRGTSLTDLVNCDVTALSKVLPRISSPTLTEFDVAQLDPADLVQLGGIFVGFLMPKAQRVHMESLTA